MRRLLLNELEDFLKNENNTKGFKFGSRKNHTLISKADTNQLEQTCFENPEK